jgi:SRSO17 transposase
MQPMAERLGVDHQGLQQFISSSTWAVEPVRERLARRAVEVIDPQAWVVDDTGFPKDGTASPGVARQYTGSLGKVGNCQVGVSISAVTDTASCPLDWRLFLPERWDDANAASPEAAAAIAERRTRAGIPAEVRHREKWRLALDMVDELAGEGLVPPVVVADAGYGDIAEFRDGLTARGRAWVVQVQGVLSAHAEGAVPARVPTSGRGRPSRPRYRTRPVALRAHVLAAGRNAVRRVTWREGSRGPLTSHLWCCGSARPDTTRASGGPPTARCRRCGCWPNGHRPSPSPPTTGSPPCRRTPTWPSWSGWPRSAGGSSTTTES